MMKIQDEFVGYDYIDEGVGEGRFKLTTEQGVELETQGGSPANVWLLRLAMKGEKAFSDDLLRHLFDITLNGTGSIVSIEPPKAAA